MLGMPTLSYKNGHGRLICRNKREKVLLVKEKKCYMSDGQVTLNFGYHSALILAGVTTVEMVKRSAVQPDKVAE